MIAGIAGLIGFLEDIFTLSSKVRLLMQVIISALIVWQFLMMPFSMITVLLFIFWIVFITGTANLYNFMDGINGIAGYAGVVGSIFRGEDLMQAHRSHLYQYLSNELKVPHWKVTLLYAVLQFPLALKRYCTRGFIPEYMTRDLSRMTGSPRITGLMWKEMCGMLQLLGMWTPSRGLYGSAPEGRGS